MERYAVWISEKYLYNVFFLLFACSLLSFEEQES